MRAATWHFFRILLALTFVFAGALHFEAPEIYQQIMPPVLPFPRALVYLSGVAEAGFGALVLLEPTRRLAAWGLVLTLIAIFPANIYMATSNVQIVGLPSFLPQPGELGRWVRLPFQGLFIYWAWVYTRPRPARDTFTPGRAGDRRSA